MTNKKLAPSLINGSHLHLYSLILDTQTFPALVGMAVRDRKLDLEDAAAWLQGECNRQNGEITDLAPTIRLLEKRLGSDYLETKVDQTCAQVESLAESLLLAKAPTAYRERLIKLLMRLQGLLDEKPISKNRGRKRGAST